MAVGGMSNALQSKRAMRLLIVNDHIGHDGEFHSMLVVCRGIFLDKW